MSPSGVAKVLLIRSDPHSTSQSGAAAPCADSLAIAGRTVSLPRADLTVANSRRNRVFVAGSVDAHVEGEGVAMY